MGKTEQGTDKQNNKSTREKEQIANTLDQRVEIEMQNIRQMLEDYKISAKRVKALESIIENTAWMKVKLDDAREAVKTSNVVIPYDNGGGQTGLRENPLFKGYESLWKSYMTGMSRILECLPNEQLNIEVEKIETPKTVLEIVRSKHRKEA